ncbi:hypothetical protein HHX47_DHR5000201 [Lentinula edodes]|nr:hypothetical protein HHX47_DHR5000201 [Lentinula edodes]
MEKSMRDPDRVHRDSLGVMDKWGAIRSRDASAQPESQGHLQGPSQLNEKASPSRIPDPNFWVIRMPTAAKDASDIQDFRHIEETPKDLYSLDSQSADLDCTNIEAVCVFTAPPPTGIDAEVAEFFASLAPDMSKGGEAVVIDDATNRRLRWMIHKRVLVVMIVTTMSFASIMGITADTHLVGQEYAWLTTCGRLYSFVVRITND